MNKKISNILIFGLILVKSIVSFGQTNNTEANSDTCHFSANIDLGVSSRNIWRGLDYGSSPSVWGDLYGSYKGFSLGAIGTTTLSGSKAQFGTWLELYASY